MGWDQASIHLKIALIVMFIGFLIFIIGFSTVSWSTRSLDDNAAGGLDHHYFEKNGLWRRDFCIPSLRPRGKVCGEHDMVGHILDAMGYKAWYRATQAMECFGLICMTLALLVLILYFFVPSFKQRRILLGVLITTFASVVFIIIGVIIFGSKMGKLGYSVGWSMALAIVGAILAFIAGVMELLEYIR